MNHTSCGTETKSDTQVKTTSPEERVNIMSKNKESQTVKIVTDLCLASFVIIATPFYEYTRWMIEQAEPYMPLGEFKIYDENETENNSHPHTE